MAELTERIYELQADQGWTDDTVLTLAIRFISERGSHHLVAFENYLERLAKEENDECSSGNQEES